MIIALTGATGFLGQLLIPRLTEKYNSATIRLIGRSEWKLAKILREHNDLYSFKKLRPLICDVRDRERVFSCLKDADLVIHTAALKRLEICNYNPQEAVKTNIIGSMNVMDACLNVGIKKSIFVSTDKAVNASNLYGRTKAVVESMVIERGKFFPEGLPILCIARYGNVIGSTGAAMPYFIARLRQNLPIPLTHPEMTRFLITKKMAWDVIEDAIDNGKQGDIIIPKELKSVSIAQSIGWLKDYLCSRSEIDLIGMWPGEKLHEEIKEGQNSSHCNLTRSEFIDMLKEDDLL